TPSSSATNPVRAARGSARAGWTWGRPVNAGASGGSGSRSFREEQLRPRGEGSRVGRAEKVYDQPIDLPGFLDLWGVPAFRNRKEEAVRQFARCFRRRPRVAHLVFPPGYQERRASHLLHSLADGVIQGAANGFDESELPAS